LSNKYLGLLEDDNDYVVLAAIKALESFARPAIVEPVAQKLYSENPQVIEQAILCLGSVISCGVVEASDPLLNFVLEHDSDVRTLAVQNLKHLEAEHLLPVIDKLRTLDDANLEGEIRLVLDDLEMRKADDVEQKLARLYHGLHSEKYKVGIYLIDVTTRNSHKMTKELIKHTINSSHISKVKTHVIKTY